MKTTNQKPVMYGEVHDVTKCCVEGFGCWIASVCSDTSRALKFLDAAGKFDEMLEASSRVEGITWLKELAAQRGLELRLYPPQGMAGGFMPIKTQADIAKYLSYYQVA
jgi:hypothetical protein